MKPPIIAELRAAAKGLSDGIGLELEADLLERAARMIEAVADAIEGEDTWGFSCVENECFTRTSTLKAALAEPAKAATDAG